MAAKAPPNENGGGHGYEFVKTPLDDVLMCTVCFLPSKEPHLSTCCGHTFCKSCYEGSKKCSNICPMCRSEEFAAIFNKQSDRKIGALLVFCTNKKQGCEWQGELKGITDHFGNCLFQVVHCPNDCGESLQRQNLTNHVEIECPRRKVSCQYCNDVGEYQFIEGQHKEECPKFPVQCPNECEIESIHRDEVEEHREVCPLEIIQCDYHVGCEVKMARKDMITHKQDIKGVPLSLNINELMEKHFSSTNKQLTHVEQAANTQFAAIENLKQQLTVSQQEAKLIKENLVRQLEHTEKNLTAKLMASEQEAKKTKENLTQQLEHTEKNLTEKLIASQQEAKKRQKKILLNNLNTQRRILWLN